MSDVLRVDAREKVTGKARYGADRTPEGLLHAAFATATIARGRIVEVDTAESEALAGVVSVTTRFGEDELGPPSFVMGGGYGTQSLQPLRGDRIAHRGQPIALVLAENPVVANHAAELITATYEPEAHASHLDADQAETLLQREAIPIPFADDLTFGDAETDMAAAQTVVDATYEHPAQNATPLELLSAVVQWHEDRLLIHEGTQNAGALRNGLARQLNLDPQQIEVRSRYLGGAFGQRNAQHPYLAPLVLAARRAGRPVKLVLTRQQTFHQASFRPQTRHRITLGADATGRMTAAVHEIDQQTSRHDLFPGGYAKVTSRLYGIPSYRSRQRLVRNDIQTPGYVRAPFEQPGVWAFESAVDELAARVGADPVAFRLANDTSHDPVSGLPFSSRHLGECLRRGAQAFGWEQRPLAPGDWTDDEGNRIGWGVAVGAYPANVTPARARVRVEPDGTVLVETDGHEMGQGLTSAVTSLVTRELGIPAEQVRVRLGDTRVGAQPLTAGSWGTASTLPAVQAALEQLKAGESGAEAGNGLPTALADRAANGLVAAAGPVYGEFAAFSFIAHFVEVRLERVTGRIRVPRVLSVADCGRVANRVTAASQVRGGVVWGLGAALREHLVTDPRLGGFLNASLEEYPISVNADICAIDVDFVDRPDPLLNSSGVKGLGEVAMVGVAPAVTNAIWHATGQRLRKLPITIADLPAGGRRPPSGPSTGGSRPTG
ncbi:xanthine dehydrogenase family protein molybdopterin-binding subunit [Kineosporia babensis]|uniref:Xanthine dehydrogenase family protein molybdopterin-binding subunit n=1 Tax=Kineosporia babensis TaxID=499548 RepID=A0A9X1NJ04_9ACTN|nr:xanthine dehydrogenase family protein molybdopterin-binding subunit [Kineosporia babensis]MCD5313983.1 xanthine dehydrogenase family protein molybdopterin-binding subunit [Kineosporia babensis]